MTEYLVGPDTSIPEGGRRVVRCGPHEVGIFRINGALHAWRNTCPHRQGPVCQGRIYPRVTEPLDAQGQTRTLAYDTDRQQLVCPWHGYEFDLTTGECQGLARMKLLPVRLRMAEATVYVEL